MSSNIEDGKVRIIDRLNTYNKLVYKDITPADFVNKYNMGLYLLYPVQCDVNQSLINLVLWKPEILASLTSSLQNEDICLAAIEADYKTINYVIYITEAIYIKEIEMNPQYYKGLGVSMITENMSIAYVSQKDCSLKDVVNQTDKICMAAVNHKGSDLQYVKNPTYDIEKAAIADDPSALQYVSNQTNQLCQMAIERNASTLQYVKVQTDEFCLAAVQINGLALQYVQHQTRDIILAALRSNINSIQYIKDWMFIIDELI